MAGFKRLGFKERKELYNNISHYEQLAYAVRDKAKMMYDNREFPVTDNMGYKEVTEGNLSGGYLNIKTKKNGDGTKEIISEASFLRGQKLLEIVFLPDKPDRVWVIRIRTIMGTTKEFFDKNSNNYAKIEPSWYNKNLDGLTSISFYPNGNLNGGIFIVSRGMAKESHIIEFRHNKIYFEKAAYLGLNIDKKSIGNGFSGLCQRINARYTELKHINHKPETLYPCYTSRKYNWDQYVDSRNRFNAICAENDYYDDYYDY